MGIVINIIKMKFTMIACLVALTAAVKLESDPICSSAGCTQYKHKKKKLGYDIDYFVPNFGRDKDINDDFDSIAQAEAMYNHKIDLPNAKWKNPAKKTMYNFAMK